MYDKPATIADTINPLTLDYNPRQVDIDRFNSYTNELRILQQYRTGKIRPHPHRGCTTDEQQAASHAIGAGHHRQ